MKYKYTPSGSGEYYPGLPACDLDDATLTAEQKKLLAAGVSKGIYKPVDASAQPKSKGKDDKAE